MPRKQKKYHFIYKTTCLITGKFYVGMHSADNIEDGYLGSGKILGYSICRHGRENHVREILEFCSSREELKQREKEMVNEELLSQPLNINLKYGGEGGGKFYSVEHQRKCSIAGGKAMGKIAAQRLHSDPEIHRKIIETRKRNGSLFTLGMLGKNHTIEAKKKMSIRVSGHKNSQFGTCWVTDGMKPIKIHKERVDEFIQLGYSLGRKIHSSMEIFR